MNKMLINASDGKEPRVALIDEKKKLYDLNIEKLGHELKKGNIYKGRVVHIEPSLEAAFIEYGGNRHGFLPVKEIARSSFQTQKPISEKDLSYPHIKDVLQEGQKLLVQIDKEERGNKGAALTNYNISLAGSYLVLMPNNPHAGGISRRIEGKGRDTLRESMSQLDLPEGMGIIVRTAGVDKSLDDLKWDLNALLKLWENIVKAEQTCEAPCLIYQEGDAILRSIRDHLRPDISEIIVDNSEVYEKIKKYLEQVRPNFVNKITFYQNKTPLFIFFNIEHQIESAHQRVVRLPSGGAIVIDHTEALVSIDVNSARATSGGDIEETALNTNLEAADEIARQLRLRDIGGLIVIDFIDMIPIRNQKEVSERLRKALSSDSARTQIGSISRFGLLEMSRQRLRPTLGESLIMICPRCDGQGTIRGIKSLAISILRMIEEEAIKKGTIAVHVQLPIDLATFLLNEKRNRINDIEKRQEVRILLLPNRELETPNYKIKRLTSEEKTLKNEASYKFLESSETEIPKIKETLTKPTEPPIVRLTEPPRTPTTFLQKIKNLGNFLLKKKKIPPAKKTPEKRVPSTRTTRTRGVSTYKQRGYRRRRHLSIGDKRGKRSPSSSMRSRAKPVDRKTQTTIQEENCETKSLALEAPAPDYFSTENYPEINSRRSKFDEEFAKSKTRAAKLPPIKKDLSKEKQNSNSEK